MPLSDKYLVVRRDGSAPAWPQFVLGARDPAAPAALRAYADAGEKAGLDPTYCADVRALADTFDTYRAAHGASDPGALQTRTDDPAAVAAMTGNDCLVYVRPDRETPAPATKES